MARQTIRVAALQTANRTIPFRAGGPPEALARVEANLDALVALAGRAADEGCRIAAFPEDCLGTLEWEAGHWGQVDQLLAPAGAMMLERLGAVARQRGMAIVCCNDMPGGGAQRNADAGGDLGAASELASGQLCGVSLPGGGAQRNADAGGDLGAASELASGQLCGVSLPGGASRDADADGDFGASGQLCGVSQPGGAQRNADAGGDLGAASELASGQLCGVSLPGGAQRNAEAGGEPAPIYNTAVLIGADGREIGRYRKVQPTLSERHRTPGDTFPVFDVPVIGPVGLCICYDMVFPETTRALALNGADLVFHCTMGGASFGEGDASLAAFRTRAADNFLYIVVAFRGGGSMILGPKGQVLATAPGGGDRVVAADIDPAAGRQAGDALGGVTADFRARLFRERNPAAYRILVDAHPPALDRLKDVPVPSAAEASALFAEGITTGTERFYEAERLQSEGKVDEARALFAALAARFGTLWMGRAARERLAALSGDR